MFGSFRTILAFFVVAAHLMSITIIGQYAVHGFFILSGYLMTHIMHHSYGYTFAGMKRFATNRFLRLFPLYWFFLVLMDGMLLMAGANFVSAFNPSMGIPQSLSGWMSNLSMVYPHFMPMSCTPRISPPTWALTVEFLFYLLICLGISRTQRLTFCWLVAGVGYYVFTHFLNLEWNHRYSSIFAGSLPFAIGASLFHLRPAMLHLLPFLTRMPGLALISLLYLSNLCGGCLVVLLRWSTLQSDLHFYFNLVLSFFMIFSLSAMAPPKPLRRMDTWIGDYSYPVYLLHYPLGMFLSFLVFGESARGFSIQGCMLFAITTLGCLVISFLTIRWIDRPIQNIREKVKSRRQTETPEGALF